VRCTVVSVTSLVPREFVQNHRVNFYLVLRKLPFGADYKSDFCYLSKSSDDWNCILVEIERPSFKFFRKGTSDLHPNFEHALQQVRKWRAWFLNAANKASFVDHTLAPMRVPLGDNPTFMKYVLVYGRRAEYAGNPVRRRLVAAQEDDDFKILTFDSLAEDLVAKHDLYVGVRKNEYVEIISNQFVSENMFYWMDPSALRINAALKENILSAKGSWFHHNAHGLVLEHALPLIKVVGDRA
jgi:hypothetical protein